MTDLPPLPSIALGRYRHYKGGAYEVLGVVRHSESLEPMVLYRPLAGGPGMWVRPYAMFVGQVDHLGTAQPRFALHDAGGTPPAQTAGVQRGTNDTPSSTGACVDG